MQPHLICVRNEMFTTLINTDEWFEFKRLFIQNARSDAALATTTKIRSAFELRSLLDARQGLASNVRRSSNFVWRRCHYLVARNAAQVFKVTNDAITIRSTHVFL